MRPFNQPFHTIKTQPNTSRRRGVDQEQLERPRAFNRGIRAVLYLLRLCVSNLSTPRPIGYEMSSFPLSKVRDSVEILS